MHKYNVLKEKINAQIALLDSISFVGLQDFNGTF